VFIMTKLIWYILSLIIELCFSLKLDIFGVR